MFEGRSPDSQTRALLVHLSSGGILFAHWCGSFALAAKPRSANHSVDVVRVVNSGKGIEICASAANRSYAPKSDSQDLTHDY